MFKLATTSQFEKDYKLCLKRGYKMTLLHKLFEQLEKTGEVSLSHKPHKLTGEYKGFLECHIRPDWLLIWQEDKRSKTITLTRTGTHADLF